MANITWLGADYQNVDKVYLPETGTGNEITFSLGGGTPSATAHTIYFEFSDGTDATIPVYYDDTVIGSLITTSKPTTYNGKIVETASLDGVQWYVHETWETVLEDTLNCNPDTPYNYFWISSLQDVYPALGSVWRITVEGTEYRCTAAADDGQIYVGNPKYSGKTDNGSDAPFSFYNAGWGAMVGDTELPANVSLNMKFERLVA